MKKILPFLAAFLVIRNDGQPMTISGLSQDDIQAQGIYTIVDKPTYDAAVAAIPKPVPVTDPVKDQAILDIKNKALTTDQRLDALIKAVGL